MYRSMLWRMRRRNRADATWYLNAKDLVPVGTVPGGSGNGAGAGKPQDKQPEKKA